MFTETTNREYILFRQGVSIGQIQWKWLYNEYRAPRSRSPRPVSSVYSFSSEDRRCDACERVEPNVALCTACDIVFCPPCWDNQVSHKKKRGSGRVRHEKTDMGLAIKIRKALEPTSNLRSLTELHEDDVRSAWFGQYTVFIHKLC
jgi:hypothetical protein